MRTSFALVALFLAACGGDSSAGDAATPDTGAPPSDAGPPDASPVPQDLQRDIVSTDLTIDVRTREATAIITVAPSTSGAASFEIGDLVISDVTGPGGQLAWDAADGQLDVMVPDTGAPFTMTIDYTFAEHSAFDGYMSNGLTFLWPYFCGNLFPCHSRPDDGLTFTLSVTGAPADTLIYPAAISNDAPSYMIALATGSYTRVDLGTTAAGTTVAVWYLPGGQADAMAGTAYLAEMFDWLEQTYGPYPYGPVAGSVSAPWGPGAYGGMEHHPYWHVATDSMSDQVTHAHEAAHGWFGNGIRIECWEDFVLSEGTVSYLAVRAIEATQGTTVSDAVWADYQSVLDGSIASKDTIAWPDGCNQIDILYDPLWSNIPYMKGAFFFRDVELMIGRATLDQALAAFYQTHMTRAASMRDLIDEIEAASGADLTPLVNGWLKSLGTP